jgi:outer membrane protein assembly factor BamE (lipoprotein component of BamABCDE complex)
MRRGKWVAGKAYECKKQIRLRRMKKLFFLSMLAAGTVALFSGCASDKSGQTETTKTEPTKEAKPEKDKRPKEQRLSVGMTKDEVRAAIGNPRNTSVSSTGEEVWMYNNSERAFIPYYSLSGGKFQTLIVNFDKDGTVKSWSSNTAGGY